MLRLTPHPGTILRLTQAQLRALTLDQFQCITECWVSLTAPLLPAAAADPLGKEARQIGQLKDHLCAFGCSIAANNPSELSALRSPRLACSCSCQGFCLPGCQSC